MKQFPGFKGECYKNKNTPLTERQRRVCQMWVLGLQTRAMICEALNYKNPQIVTAIVNSPPGKAYCKKLSQTIEERFVALAIAKSLEAFEKTEKRLNRRFE